MFWEVFALFIILIARSADAQCVLRLPRFGFFAPLVFDTDGNLLAAEGYGDDIKIKIQSSHKVILSCFPNYFDGSNDQKHEAECKDGQTLLINNSEKQFGKDLECRVRVIEEVNRKITGCNVGELTGREFGYVNPIKNKSYVLGEACYDLGDGRVTFVHTQLPGITSLENEHVQLSIQNAEYFNENYPEDSYKSTLLEASNWNHLSPRLKAKLGPAYPVLRLGHYLGVKNLQNKQFLSTLKLPWNYVIINGDINLPNLELLHEDIKNLNVPNYELYIGNHDTLMIRDVPIMLRDDGYPVPKFLWLVVKIGAKAAAFIISNNPDANVNDIEKLCLGKCSEMIWLKKLLADNVYKNPKKGYVLCCSLDDFKFKEMPNLGEKLELLDKI